MSTVFFFFSSRRRHTRLQGDWSSDVCSSDLGNRVRAKVVKNKIAPPLREAEFDILFESGISYEGDLLDMGVNETVIDKSGAWFNYGNVRLGQGREQARQFLKDNPEVAKEVREKVLVKKTPQEPVEAKPAVPKPVPEIRTARIEMPEKS